jgi:asparagine synthase (glutamine-hydrolysing)
MVGAFADWHASALGRMVEAQRHRGPDGGGVEWLQVGKDHLGFGHRRLAIQDLSEAGHQPMKHPSSGDVLVFNGEIYNAPALRRQLESEGERFRGHSDTEVLLHALGRWGTHCLRDLDGMYAFAWFDRRNQRLVLARDPLGIKPLYTVEANGSLLYSSEVRALVASGQISTKLDLLGLSSLLAYGSVQAPRTLLRGVRTFPAGHWQAFRVGDGIQASAPQSHWTFPPAESNRRHDDTIASVRELLGESVKRHLLSDVPVGVFLSSGIDSTIVASLASQHQTNIKAFTVGFTDAEDHSEAELAGKTAEALSIPHQTLWLSENEAKDAVLPWLDSLDQPSMDGLNTYVLSKRLRESGIVVALSGQGGDELFGGYPSFQDVPKLLRLVRLVRKLPSSLQPSSIAFLSAGRGVAFREKLANMIHVGADLRGLALQRRRCFSDAQITRLLRKGPSDEAVRNHYLEPSEFAKIPISDDDPIHAVSLLESKFYLGNTLLPVGDASGMSHGLEIRVPMLDRPVLNAVLGLPGELRLPRRIADKHLLRHAFANFLRPDLTSQSKRGFVLPVKRWMTGQLRPVCESALATLKSHECFREDGVESVWKTYLREPETPIWSRAWLLVALGQYLQCLKSTVEPPMISVAQ